MKRRILFLAFAALVIFSAFKKKKIISPLPTNVNVVEIIIDDMGYEVPTYSGGQSYSTPTMDGLAAGSNIQFRQCHGSPTCTPSRLMLYSGKYNFRNYFINRQIDGSVLTVANLCKLGGYGTALYGKWQLNGFDNIRSLYGFDRYSVLFPGQDEDGAVRYKNPTLYHPISPSAGDYYYPTAYSDDVFADSVCQFMQDMTTAGTPFYCQYSMSLTHSPFSPTPDDVAAYAAWNPDKDRSDISYYASMVTYADKKIKQVMDKITALGISNNTVVFILGDNGTSADITSQWNGQTVSGGKKSTINWATNVPSLVIWPSHTSHTTNTNLISFTDYLPTISDITGIAIPGGWGTIDGRSFYPLLTGAAYTASPYWYIYWGPVGTNTKIWAMRPDPTSSYLIKKYDGGFIYNTTLDIDETCPITDPTNSTYLSGIINGLYPIN